MTGVQTCALPISTKPTSGYQNKRSVYEVRIMDKKEKATKTKKKYEKPKITRIKLDATTAVLAACKTSGAFGPGGVGCIDFFGDACSQAGS